MLMTNYKLVTGYRCNAGCQWQTALSIYYAMPSLGLAADKITYSSVISALSKGRMWETALQVSMLLYPDRMLFKGRVKDRESVESFIFLLIFSILSCR